MLISKNRYHFESYARQKKSQTHRIDVSIANCQYTIKRFFLKVEIESYLHERDILKSMFDDVSTL